MEINQSDIALLAARTAILVMRAAVQDAGAESERAILSEPSLPTPKEVGTDTELAALLARLPKPQSCTPDLRDGVLVIRCVPLPPGGAAVIRGVLDQLFAQGIDHWLTMDLEDSPGTEQKPGQEPGTHHVLLVTGGKSLLLPFEAVDTYFRGYLIEGIPGYRIDDRSPSDAERQRGAEVVLEIIFNRSSPTGTRIMEYPE